MKKAPPRQGGFLVSRIHRESKRRFARSLAEHGITLSAVQGRVLFPLWREGRLPIHELVRRTGLGKSTLSGLLDRLERAGHVRRVRFAQDRRVVEIEAIGENGGYGEAVARASAEMSSLFYEGFSKAEVERFERDLGRVLENLTKPPRKGKEVKK
jgi:MarR family transcriptional regulator, organic hydroperoxide resistance regulator